ncbi:MAG: hypothetical protein QM733_19555 [Ilumatobacteraceae bacterium]
MSRRGELWQAVRQDWVGAGAGGRALLVAATCILLYEWSAGNETATTLLITELLRRHESVPSVMLAGVVAGALVLVEQVLSGLVFIAALGRLPRLVGMIVTTVQQRFGTSVPPYRELPATTRVGVAFVMGTSFVATEDALAGATHRRRSIVVSAATAATTVFAITGVIGGALIAAHGTRFEGPVKVVYSIAGDWRFWLAVLLLPPLVGALARRCSAALGRPAGPVDPR